MSPLCCTWRAVAVPCARKDHVRSWAIIGAHNSPPVVIYATEVREIRAPAASIRPQFLGNTHCHLVPEDVAVVKVVTTLTALLLVISTSATADRGIASIRVTPAMSLEPANVLLQVVVERHADNRLLMVTVDSGAFYWSSERQLDGQDGPYLSVFICRELPAGEYEVNASIIGSDGKVRGRASNRIVVVSTGGP